MQPELKQRLIGAAVLVALAVIFLPMLIKGPAPESGASDVSLELPDAPQGDYVTRELPLVTPARAPAGGVVGMDSGEGRGLPTVDTTDDDAAAGGAFATDAMTPPPTAGGDYAVSFGSYASEAGAGRVVAALRASQLPGYQEATDAGDRTLYRVRVGPFASRATAEAARLRAAHVRDDVDSRVVVLDAASAGPRATDESTATVSGAVSGAVSKSADTSEPAGATPETADAPAPDAAPDEPVASQTEPGNPPSESPSEPVAAAAVGFAVQLGAFNNDAQAIVLRDRARAAGFTAFVEQVRTDEGSLSRVQVGPVIDRAAAERLQAQVAAKLGVNGFVHSHP